MDSAALFVEEALATEELREWLSVSVMHDCLTGIDGLYNPLLLGVVNDSEDLAASAMDFAPGMSRSTIGGRRGCNKFVPVLGRDGTRMAPPGTYLTNSLVK